MCAQSPRVGKSQHPRVSNEPNPYHGGKNYAATVDGGKSVRTKEGFYLQTPRSPASSRLNALLITASDSNAS